MILRAIGVIETRGMPNALIIADIMGKAADVEILGFENIDAGRISIIIRGVTGAVQAAIAAATRQTIAASGLLGHHIVPCPDEAVDIMTLIGRSRHPLQPDRVEWLDD
ncbi:MAG: BMC domain-containing protein [Leptolyngbyaceae cyanobacterium]